MSLCSRHKLFRNVWTICLFVICCQSPELCLAQEQNQDNVSNLIQKLYKGTEDDRWSAAQALGNMGNTAKQAAPDLEKALKDKSESVRWAAAEALGKIGVATPTTIAALKDALNNDSDKNVRINAAEALGNIGVCSPVRGTGLADSPP